MDQTVSETKKIVSFFGEKIEDRSPADLFKFFVEFSKDVISAYKNILQQAKLKKKQEKVMKIEIKKKQDLEEITRESKED